MSEAISLTGLVEKKHKVIGRYQEAGPFNVM